MSLISSFIVKHVVGALETQFLSHLPELRQEFLDEVSNLVKIVSDWVESKVNSIGAPSDEEAKGS